MGEKQLSISDVLKQCNMSEANFCRELREFRLIQRKCIISYINLLPDDSVILDNMLFELNYLFEDTKLLNNNLDCSVNQYISLCTAVSELAYILHGNNTDIPDVCLKLASWKELSNDLTEFSEVRNRWCDL